MSEEASLAAAGGVGVYCFTYSNPFSINGPFGDIKLVVPDSDDTVGDMTLNLLFGLPTKAWMALSGTCTGTSQHTCRLVGTGYSKQFGQAPIAIQMKMTLTMAPDWQSGTLVFEEGVMGVSGGLPVKRTDCQT
jgi:hypothetical protein